MRALKRWANEHPKSVGYFCIALAIAVAGMIEFRRMNPARTTWREYTVAAIEKVKRFPTPAILSTFITCAWPTTRRSGSIRSTPNFSGTESCNVQ